MKKYIAFIIFGFFTMSQKIHPQLFSLGLTSFVCVDHSRQFDNLPRTLNVTVWYPTHDTSPLEKIENPTWKIKDVIRNASFPENIRFPLLIFSHGYSGNQWQNSWIIEHLVQHGYIVAAIRHYGNSYPNMIPELCARPWNRPEDMSFVLDHILQNTEFTQHIDQTRIGAAGFSQGGAACLWLAGVQAHLTPDNLKQQITLLYDPRTRDKHFKDISDEHLNAVLERFEVHDFEQANKSYYDNRFKTLCAIAPGLDEKNFMFTPQGLALASIPLHIIVGAADDGTVEQCIFFNEHISYSTCTIIPGEVTHWTLLNEGTEQGKINNPYFTTDHPSIDRYTVHQQAAEEIVAFFDRYLK